MRATADRLLERERELAAIDALVGEARAGRGALLLIEGPAGIGKTRLLQAARERAEATGMRALAARGSELERNNPFGITRRLLEPVLAKASAPERKRLLRGAAALSRRALEAEVADPRTHGGEMASFAVLEGLYSLSANLADEVPLALVVDDAQWADRASLRFGAFLGSRLEEIATLLVLALRTGEPATEPRALERLASEPGAKVLVPDPLSERAVAELVRASLAPEAEEAFCDACHQATGGNPFLVRELVLELAAGGVEPRSRAAPQVRGIAPRSVARSVVLRIARLGDEAAELARAVAVLGGDGIAFSRAAELAGLELKDAAEAADALARISILAEGRPLTFAHPLVRSAIYSDMRPGLRAEAHRRAARALHDEDADPERIASHLLATEPNGEKWVVDRLRLAARRALSAGATAEAATYLRRALAEPPLAESLPAVLLELGAAQVALGDEKGAAYLEEGLALTTDFEIRAAYLPKLARAHLFLGRPEKAIARIGELLAPGGERSAETRLQIEAELIALAQCAAPTAHFADELLDAAPDLPAEGGTTGQRLMLAAKALNAAKRCAPAAEAAALAEGALAGGELLAAAGPESMAFWNAVWTLLGTDHLHAAARALEQALAESRKGGFAATTVVSLTMRSHWAWLHGNVADAEADARSALGAAEPHELVPIFPHAVAYLVDALIEREQLEAADEALVEAGFGQALPESHMHDIVMCSRGRLRLAQGKLRDAVDDLLEVGRRRERWGMRSPFDTAWAPLAAPALAALGERSQARALAERELEQSRRWGLPRSIGMSLRALGLVIEGDERLTLLAQAADVLDGSPARLERARALSDLGAALRRAGRRADAREPLRAALEIGRRCRATAIAARAHGELEATGERLPRLTLVGVESLTPSELRVARMAAEGLSNRDVAQALFLSLKTVEKHLSSTYRKLDVESRKDLPALLGAERT